MALFYAASEQGDYKAANAARKLAYTEVKDEASSAPVTSNKRYVNADIGLNVRESPGTNSQKIGYLNYNDEVEFTGNKTGEINNHLWAEIKYGGKTGWVIANSLRTKRSSDMPYGVDLSDHEGLQSSFYKVTETFTKDDLQCVFLTRWFLNNYTTLQTSTGDGFAQAKNTFDANSDKNLQISNIPSAPAIYSVAPYSAGPGISEERATKWGHTGIILDCQKVSGKEDTYNITYFHTGSSFKGKPFNCAITTKEVKVNDAVTYVNIGNYMK